MTPRLVFFQTPALACSLVGIGVLCWSLPGPFRVDSRQPPGRTSHEHVAILHPVPSDNGIRHGGTFTVNSAEYSRLVIGSADERLYAAPSSQRSNENRWLFSAQWFHSFASVYILITIQLHVGTEKRIDWTYQSPEARGRKMKSIRLL